MYLFLLNGVNGVFVEVTKKKENGEKKNIVMHFDFWCKLQGLDGFFFSFLSLDLKVYVFDLEADK